MNSGGYVYLYKFLSETISTMGSTSIGTPDSHHDIEVRKDGAFIDVLVDGNFKFRGADVNLYGGKVGLMTWDGSGRFDDFSFNSDSSPVAGSVSSPWTEAGNPGWLVVDKDGLGDMAVDHAGYGSGITSPVLLHNVVTDAPSEFILSASVRLASGSNAGLLFNYQDQSNFYFISMNSGGYVYLYKFLSETISTMGSTSIGTPDSHHDIEVRNTNRSMG
jgi:hypothetical protein